MIQRHFSWIQQGKIRALPWSVPSGIVAACLGGLMALLPPASAVLLLAAAALSVCMAITPLSALVVMLVIAPMRTLIETEAGFRLPLEIGRVTTLLVICAWAAHQILRKPVRFPRLKSPVLATLLMFLIIGGLTGLSATSMSAWVSEWLKWVLILILAALVMNSAGGHKWEWIIFAIVAAGAANAIVGIYIYFGGSGALHLLVNGTHFRAFGTFGQPNPFGGFMGLGAPLALTSAFGYGLVLWTRWRWSGCIDWKALLLTGAYLAAFGLLAGGLVLSWSRGAWLAFGISMCMTVILLPKRRVQSVAAALILVSLITVLWTADLLPLSITQRVESAAQELFAVEDTRARDITPENYAVLERLAHWQAAVNIAAAYPWLGVGLGNYEVVYPEFRLLNWDEPLGHAHNYYLNVLSEGGIIGFSGYLIFWLVIFGLTLRCRMHPDPVARSVSIGLLGVWTYLAIHSLTDNLYVNNIFLHLGVMFGVLAVLDHQTRSGYQAARLRIRTHDAVERQYAGKRQFAQEPVAEST